MKPTAVGVLVALLSVWCDHPAFAQRLPVRTYTTADGLAGDDVRAILQDERGFLWVGTSTGLSRFDGREFRTYGTADGLPHPAINHLLQDQEGTIWVATGGGLARLDRTARTFAALPLDEEHRGAVRLLHSDRAGTLWVAAGTHLFSVTAAGEVGTCIRVPVFTEPRAEIESLAEAPDGTFWIGTTWGLIERRPDGELIRWRVRPSVHDDRVSHLAFDASGHLWMTHWGIAHRPGVNWALYVLHPHQLTDAATETDVSPLLHARWREMRPAGSSSPGDPLPVSYLTGGGPFGDARVHGAYVARGGRLWLATEEGVVRVDADGVRRFGAANGLGLPFRVVAEDRDGNLWLGSRGSGLSRLETGAPVTYTEREGLHGREITAIVEDRTGRLCVSGVDPDGRRWFGALTGERIRAFSPGGTERLTYWGWGWGQTLLQDRHGEWWLPTGEGLYRYPASPSCTGLDRLRPRAVYRRAQGLSADDIFRLFEDSAGDVWISTFGDPGLQRWVRATGRFEPFPQGRSTPSAFAEDRAGSIWVGLYDGGLLRYRHGEIQHFGEQDGVPAGFIEDLHLDTRGRLWVASAEGGLARADAPESPQPVFTRPIRSDGLGEDAVLSLVEDRLGQFYASTGRGVIQFDGEMRRLGRLSTAEGLGSNLVRTSYVDRRGVLWFGTLRGLSQLTPRHVPRLEPPPIFIQGLRLAGVPHPVAQLGQPDIHDLVLGPGDGRVEIEYGVAGLAAGDAIRYQVQLEGADRTWHEPTTTRSMLYLNLAPGSYRFLARAVYGDGRVSARPATVTFTVLPPIWHRAWFVLLTVIALVATVWGLHRQRVTRLLALERVRTALATDLHDDLGARLSRISILSEAARLRLPIGADDASRILDDVGATARELLESSSDIVWSIDPAHDDLRSLASRIRRFASDMLDSRGIAWTFETSEDGALARVSPLVRRHVLLVFQEAINNVARHADARHVWLALHVDDHRLQADIRDDGRGFVLEDPLDGASSSPAADERVREYSGRGLRSMAGRARDLKGTLEVSSTPDRGTWIRMVVPRSHA